MFRRTTLYFALLGAGLACSSAAYADEKVRYVYDARGRLVEVKRDATSTANTNVKSCYKYDKAGNRINVTVTTTTVPVPACPA